MLVYVDESYREAKTPNCKSTFAAVCIHEDGYREFDTDIFKLKKHFWKIQNPADLELKGRLLLSERALELPKNREFVRQLLVLMREYTIVPFAVVQDGSIPLSGVNAYSGDVGHAFRDHAGHPFRRKPAGGRSEATLGPWLCVTRLRRCQAGTGLPHGGPL